jgi:2-oxoisovalerate dehydrogenase E1 component alpha subunit
MPIISYLDEKGILSKACKRPIPDDILVKGYQTMVRTRHIDERMTILQRQGAITFAMSALGEEACAVASAAALEPEDWMYPQYREAGIIFWRGYTPQQFIHHMFCNAEDIILGHQMPNHFGSRELNVVTVSSPIATQIPHAAGCAYAMKLQKEHSVAICYFGEGATSEGDFHTGLNFAAVRKAPVIFFCRNNGYAISTPSARQFATDGVAAEGIGHGITTYRVDGNDFFAIHETVSKARSQCLQGEGPIFIEALTYRMGAHSTSDDPSRYRPDSEVEKWKEKCPVLRLRRYLEGRRLWNKAKEEELLADINKEVTEAINAAKKIPKPPLRSLFDGVYFELPAKLREQYAELKEFFPEG